jgi:hypothetical protein
MCRFRRYPLFTGISGVLKSRSWQSSRRAVWRNSRRTAMRKQIWQPLREISTNWQTGPVRGEGRLGDTAGSCLLRLRAGQGVCSEIDRSQSCVPMRSSARRQRSYRQNVPSPKQRQGGQREKSIHCGLLRSARRPRPATLRLGHRVDLHLTEFQRSARPGDSDQPA